MYGDKRLGDTVNKTNMRYCNEAIQKSADEIYDCWKTQKTQKTQKIAAPSSFGVWQIAPTLASANATQGCCPSSSGVRARRPRNGAGKTLTSEEIWILPMISGMRRLLGIWRRVRGGSTLRRRDHKQWNWILQGPRIVTRSISHIGGKTKKAKLTT